MRGASTKKGNLDSSLSPDPTSQTPGFFPRRIQASSRSFTWVCTCGSYRRLCVTSDSVRGFAPRVTISFILAARSAESPFLKAVTAGGVTTSQHPVSSVITAEQAFDADKPKRLILGGHDRIVRSPIALFNFPAVPQVRNVLTFVMDWAPNHGKMDREISGLEER